MSRQAKKAALANFVWKTTKQVNAVLPNEVSYVIDGGFLLHLLTWCRGSTYNQIAQSYVDFANRIFTKHVTKLPNTSFLHMLSGGAIQTAVFLGSEIRSF